MIKVQIANLKNSLSEYLRKVREGAEILVTDRDLPIARIVPLSTEKNRTPEEILAQLKKEGLVHISFSAKTRSRRIPRVKMTPGMSASELLSQDRDS